MCMARWDVSRLVIVLFLYSNNFGVVGNVDLRVRLRVRWIVIVDEDVADSKMS